MYVVSLVGESVSVQEPGTSCETIRNLPEEMACMGNGIGFTIKDDDSIYSGEFDLVSANRLDVDIINSIPYYRDSPLVQKAIEDIKRLMPEVKIIEPVQHGVQNPKERKQAR